MVDGLWRLPWPYNAAVSGQRASSVSPWSAALQSWAVYVIASS